MQVVAHFVSKTSIGGLAFQLFRTPLGGTSSSVRGFDGRNLKNSQTKSDFFLIGLSRAITLRNVELDFASGVWEVETELLVLIHCLAQIHVVVGLDAVVVVWMAVWLVQNTAK